MKILGRILHSRRPQRPLFGKPGPGGRLPVDIKVGEPEAAVDPLRKVGGKAVRPVHPIRLETCKFDAAPDLRLGHRLDGEGGSKPADPDGFRKLQHLVKDPDGHRLLRSEPAHLPHHPDGLLQRLEGAFAGAGLYGGKAAVKAIVPRFF